jgi:hypothetical protein
VCRFALDAGVSQVEHQTTGVDDQQQRTRGVLLLDVAVGKPLASPLDRV